MAGFRDDSSSVVPTRRLASNRALLPFEAELCETVGLTTEEYFYFQQLTDAYNGKRAQEYELAGVPDASNGPIAPIVINLAIGLALSAISYLLTPKPSSKNPPSLKTADKSNVQRFLQTEGFSSVQEPATLGSVIPIVFARQEGTTGGVRVNGMLLWSQLLSKATGQQLKAAMLLSMGELAADPDFAGIAIGDQTLQNYTLSKIALYFRANGGRLRESDRYRQGTLEADPSRNDILEVATNRGGRQPWFSSTRTPSTQTQFGCYSPMPNGSAYNVNYELVMTGKDASKDQKKADEQKRKKIATDFPTYAAIDQPANQQLSSGDTCSYVILGNAEGKKVFKPWGADDVNASTEDARNSADDQLQVGDSYMAGAALVVCTRKSDDRPWNLGETKRFWFRCIEGGFNDRKYADRAGNVPYGFVLQRVAIATIANSRECDVTEIGLKSTVWRQINGFPNVNSEPDDETIKDYEEQNGSISLGALNRYVKRLSFFTLETRRLGAGGGWRDLSGGRLFCVRGRTPTAQYNYIRIEHDRGQYEFRFKPVPGAMVYRAWRGKMVYLLGPYGVRNYRDAGMSVSFSALTYNLDDKVLSNPDWLLKGGRNNSSKPKTRDQSSLYNANESAGGIASRQLSADERNSKEKGTPKPSSKTVPAEWRLVQRQYKWDTTCTYEYGPRDILVARWNGTNIQLGQEFPVGTDKTGKYLQGAEKEDKYPPGGTLVKGGRISVPVYEIEYWELGQAYNGDVEDESNWERQSGKPLHLNPYDVIADYKRYDAENSSHFDGPEHEVVYVNEQLRQEAPRYRNLAYLGLRINSTKEWASFQQLSAYIKKGVIVERLINNNGNPVAERQLYGPTNNLAEIVYALLTDPQLGAGKSIGRKAVSRGRMVRAARWCHANDFTWDGVIGERLNLREWIFQQAGYALLDFTVLGGRFSLVPSFPYTTEFKLFRNGKPEISALFTDGNIRNLQVAWLSPEERQLFKAVVKWRQETPNGFPRTRVLSIRLSNKQGGSDADPEESFDMSEFCTTARQARIFARTALKLRREVQHGLSFETTPQAAMSLEPGAYFRLVSEVTHTSRFDNGSIDDGGRINCVGGLPDGPQEILYWKQGTQGVQGTTINVANNVCLEAEAWGTVFTLSRKSLTSRVYKVESLAYSDEGWVTISGSHQPLTEDGSLAVLDWEGEDFEEEGA